MAPEPQGSALQGEGRDGWPQRHFIGGPLHTLEQLVGLGLAQFGIVCAAVLLGRALCRLDLRAKRAYLAGE